MPNSVQKFIGITMAPVSPSRWRISGCPIMQSTEAKRPDYFDKGVEYNAWLEYEWDTVLEFCLMVLEEERYTGHDITAFMPFIQSSPALL